jgi:hypothetical protein
MITINHRRPDGSLVGSLNGLPYHFVVDGEHWPAALAALDEAALTPEPDVAVRPDIAHQPLSPFQLSTMLERKGVLSSGEADAFAETGEIPAALLAQVTAALAAAGVTGNAASVEIRRLKSALEYQRKSPLAPLLGAILDMDDAALDQFWRDGALI